MRTGQDLEDDMSNKKGTGLWAMIKKDVFGNASLGWGFFLGFLVHKYLLSVGKIGLLWRLF